MQLTIFEDRERQVPLMQFNSGDDGSVTVHFREPLNMIHLLKNEADLVKTFLENR